MSDTMKAPKSFNRFVGLLIVLTYEDGPFDETISSIFMSTDPEDRKIFLDYIDYLLKISAETNELKEIWDRSPATITMKDGETVLRFLSAIKPICENAYQQMLEARLRQTGQ